jgi:DNA primase
VIVSSLKDGMCLKKMYPNIDFLAPDSENTMIKKEYLDSISGNYKNCVILFDNDDAGNRAAVKYCSQFNYLKSLYLPFSKDISDSVKDHGYQKIKEYLDNYYDNIYHTG